MESSGVIVGNEVFGVEEKKKKKNTGTHDLSTRRALLSAERVLLNSCPAMSHESTPNKGD